MIEAVAAGFGRTVRAFLFAIGPCLIVYGVDLIYRPAGYIIAGAFMTLFHVKLKPRRGANGAAGSPTR